MTPRATSPIRAADRCRSLASPPAPLGRYTEKIESITKDQLEAAAAKFLNTDDSVLLVVGDGEKVADGLSALEFGGMKRLDVDGEPLG